MIANAKAVAHGIRAMLYVSGESRNKKHPRKDNAHLRQLHAAGYGRYGYLDGNEVRYHEPPQHQEQCHPHGD